MNTPLSAALDADRVGVTMTEPTSGDRVTRSHGLVVGLSRCTLFVVLFLMYAGVMPFLINFSPLLLYGTYVVFGICTIGILAFDWGATRNLNSTIPYLIWLLVVYCYWGTLVGGMTVDLGQVVRVFLRNCVFVSVFQLAVADRRGLTRAAQCFQFGAILNFAIDLLELRDPTLNLRLALMLDPDGRSLSVLRPAGLWSNPNEASFAFVFAFLLSRWAGPVLGWLGRLSCVVGIFLSASRTGVSLLILCSVFYLAFNLRSILFNVQRLMVMCVGIVMIAAIAPIVVRPSALSSLDFSSQLDIKRLSDFSEASTRGVDDASRLDLKREAFQEIMRRPWAGFGIFRFEVSKDELDNPPRLTTGAHDVYIAVWGETGILGLTTYLLLLGIGMHRAVRAVGISKNERLMLVLMWVSYLVIGFTWHDQFSSFMGPIYVALLYHVPTILQRKPASIAMAGRIQRAMAI